MQLILLVIIMVTITLHSHVNNDGSLQLELPDELKDQDVTVIVQTCSTPEDLGWPPNFFEDTYGSIPDLTRPPQGTLPQR
jgi:hypothetical protein